MLLEQERKRNLELLGLVCENTIKEERITNKKAKEFIDKRENFVGSHTYGEDLGELDSMYVAYSYGEQHPLYLYDASEDRWYYNTDDYINKDGDPNIWTRKHLRDLRPNNKVHGIPKSLMLKKISTFKQAHKLGDNTHADHFPGEED